MAPRTEEEKVVHLLRRFGLGATGKEVDRYRAGGVQGAIRQLFAEVEEPDRWAWPSSQFVNAQGNLHPTTSQILWYCRLLLTSRPLLEKMTLFWHDHFSVSVEKVDSADVMEQHVEVLRRNALGSFPVMLREVSQDPAMLYWLDNHLNLKGRPNENFAREVMELFTLGIGHYTEKDVQEAARAFTGWTIGRKEQNGQIVMGQRPRPGAFFTVNERRHDTDVKTVLGKTGNLDGGDVLQILVDHPQTPRALVKKMWEWFAYPNPDSRLVERLASVYRRSGLNTGALVKAIMESPEFYSEEAVTGVVKTPVDFVISTSRAMELDELFAKAFEAAASSQDTKVKETPIALGGMLRQASNAMGMILMRPPDVAGWEIGEGWITTSTMVERMKWGERLIFAVNRARQMTGEVQGKYQREIQRDHGERFYRLVGSPQTPDQLVEGFLALLDARALAGKRQALVQAAAKSSGGKITPDNVQKTLGLLTKAAFGSPEFQFA